MKTLRWGTLLLRYARDRLFPIVLAIACPAVFALICALTGAPLAGVVYACVLVLAGAVIALWVDLPRYVRRHRELQSLLDSCLYAATVLPSPHGLLEEDWRALLLCAIDQSAGQTDAHDRDRRDREAYAALWAHQIKVPLAAMRMLLQAEPGPASDRLSVELFKVEQYVEMSLGYQRLSGPSTDFSLRECDVNAVMLAAARRFAPLFIQKKLRLNYQETTLRALTDEKWLAFVLEQVLSNAVKYTRRGSVTLRADEDAHAVIVEDTGIGIAPEDLPRVFDHGYTGLNGREDKRATGLGLYLCKRVLDQLGHTIAIASEPGRGTRVTIGLDSLRMRME